MKGTAVGKEGALIAHDFIAHDAFWHDDNAWEGKGGTTVQPRQFALVWVQIFPQILALRAQSHARHTHIYTISPRARA